MVRLNTLTRPKRDKATFHGTMHQSNRLCCMAGSSASIGSLCRGARKRFEPAHHSRGFWKELLGKLGEGFRNVLSLERENTTRLGFAGCNSAAIEHLQSCSEYRILTQPPTRRFRNNLKVKSVQRPLPLNKNYVPMAETHAMWKKLLSRYVLGIPDLALKCSAGSRQNALQSAAKRIGQRSVSLARTISCEQGRAPVPSFYCRVN